MAGLHHACVYVGILGCVTCCIDTRTVTYAPSLYAQFGGNAVSMAAAEAVLCIMEEERLQENATEVGEHLMQEAKKLMAKHPQHVGDVR